MTRLSLIKYLSSFLLRSELEELEDSGLAKLLSINEKISNLTLATADNPEKWLKLGYRDQ